MTVRFTTPIRRLFAAFALLGTMSAVVVPMCAALEDGRAPTEDCAPGDHQQTQHHLAALCLLGSCAPLPPLMELDGEPQAPAQRQPVTPTIQLTSVAPQHALPPPRS